MTAPIDPRNRPRPLAEAADEVNSTRGAWMTLVTFLVSGGMFGAGSGQFWTVILGLVPAVLSLIATALATSGVVKLGEPKVTPVSDPAKVIDGTLVPLVPQLPATPPIYP